MHLPKRILVAIDFSESAETALDYAVGLAKELHANVIVMHAYELPIYGFPSGALVASAEMASRIMTGAQEGLDAACKARASSGVEISQVLRQGVAWEEVHSVADEMNADLIVIGTHGRQGLSRALLGSVAEKIIRTSTRPVLTLHQPAKKSG
jgi:nucleotide-binding universal stress UspA family protein